MLETVSIHNKILRNYDKVNIILKTKVVKVIQSLVSNQLKVFLNLEWRASEVLANDLLDRTYLIDCYDSYKNQAVEHKEEVTSVVYNCGHIVSG